MHPRNRHQGRYDIPALTLASPAFAAFVAKTPYGELSIDFANPEAVKALNRALLIHYYGLKDWDIPPGYLCPPIPGRADYVHTIGDLLAEFRGGPSREVPRGDSVRGLDIGVGSNLIYPIIGAGEYGWSFVGTEVDAVAMASAERILNANASLRELVELRTQPSKTQFFRGVVKPDEKFDFTICNPPFHGSAEQAAAGSERKWRNLGKESGKSGKSSPKLNFGGQPDELWYPGGEVGFIARMIEESREFAQNIEWFTTLVSRENNLPYIEEHIIRAKVSDVHLIPMGQGQKISRVVAWTFR